MDGASWFDDDRYTTRPQRQPQGEAERQSLQNCRLVSKAYCGAASPFLFRSVKAASSHALSRILALSESNYALCVHEIAISLSAFSNAVNTREGYENDLCVILPICIRNLPKLRVLFIAEPQSGTVEVSEELRQVLLAATQNTFKYGLFPKLEELDLRLALAYDFGVLARSGFMVEPTKLRRHLKEVFSQLRHLHVGILDNSGSFGQRYYSSHASSSQALFPNPDHPKEFFTFVEMATRLESLSISCTHVLDMDMLSIVHFRQLHVLVSARIKVSMAKLQGLILQNKSTIRALDFHQLELITGTWQSLLLSLSSLPHLKYFDILSCGYIQTSPYACGLLPPMDVPQDLETFHYFEDYDALGDLQRHVMRVRDAAGLAQMTEYDFKWGYRESILSELSVSTD